MASAIAAEEIFDVVVVGGGPAGATAADDLARRGRKVALLDKAGRIKPCGGAIPPRLIRDFAIPDHLLRARVNLARMISPSGASVDMPIKGGFVGMVDRADFDEWLRNRAAESGARRVTGAYEKITREGEGAATVHYKPKAERPPGGADLAGARGDRRRRRAYPQVGRQEVPGAGKTKFVFAYHEIVEIAARRGDEATRIGARFITAGRCRPISTPGYFPHGDTMSVGTGSANKGFSLKTSVKDLRGLTRLDAAGTVRKEGAPIPLKPLRKWDNGRDVILAGDAAGVVAPASGEGIYYAMLGGRLSAPTRPRNSCAPATRARWQSARRRFMRLHGRVFWVLGIMQYFWYRSDKRRESFVKLCRDPDIQRLTWEAYMNKELVRADPMAHVRIFFKDLAHLFRLASP